MLLLIFKILFGLSVLAIIHPYTIYPIFLFLKTRRKKTDFCSYKATDKLPFVSIIMAAHNEEQVLEKKIHSILANQYPENLYEIIIGSDASTDGTNQILEGFEAKKSNFHSIKFAKRTGKINIINTLVNKAKGNILLLSDADIMFAENTIFELIKYFKENKIGLVDSNLQKHINRNTGIATQEKFYINYELLIKNKEGLSNGYMMGPFGGAYAIRKELFSKVPGNFLVDDFYINMQVIEKGSWCINNFSAIVFDNSSDNIQDEFKRKIRISTGNFQNLKHFRHILFSKNHSLAFYFLSHKVIRWFAPLFIITLFISTVFLSQTAIFYSYFGVLLFFSLIVPFIDYFLRENGIHIILLRFISHYYYMNLGLLIGLFKYIKGVNTNVWKPTKRESKS
jgi:cellulose synthase/poly-beta-1,6-N-acetylglucosamine synthase-like glycosyltransferase